MIPDLIPDAIGFTGTQDGMRDAQLDEVKDRLYRLYQKGADWFHHGDCEGADEEARSIAGDIGYQIHRHPGIGNKRAGTSFNKTEEPKAYLVRNHDIVDATAILIAAPRAKLEQQRSGTWATVRYARKLGRPIYIVLPDGSSKRENIK